MTTIFIILGLIITYFIISAIKEGEARETVQKERQVNKRELANLYFENMLEQELTRQKNLGESRRVFIRQLENEENIHKVSFEENTLIIVTEYEIGMFEATEYANMWINTLIPSTGVDEVKVYNRDGIICGSAKRIIKS
jgi:hypothetical protein